MKKLVLLFMLFGSLTFALEITSIDPLDFGTVVAGDRSVSIRNSGIYVEGSPGKQVEIIIPETYKLNGNTIIIRPKERIITLDENGEGVFRLDLTLNLSNIEEYETLTNNLTIKVRYIK